MWTGECINIQIDTETYNDTSRQQTQFCNSIVIYNVSAKPDFVIYNKVIVNNNAVFCNLQDRFCKLQYGFVVYLYKSIVKHVETSTFNLRITKHIL